MAFITRHHERSDVIQKSNDNWIASSCAPRNDEFAGYVTLKWQSQYPSFKAQNIPEIMDLNVLPACRKIGNSYPLDDAMVLWLQRGCQNYLIV